MGYATLHEGEFSSFGEPAERVIVFINDYNPRARPFRWTYDGGPLKVAQVTMIEARKR